MRVEQGEDTGLRDLGQGLDARVQRTGALGVCESGLHGPADLARMNDCGYFCFLVGESLMRQSDVAAATAALLARPRAMASGD